MWQNGHTFLLNLKFWDNLNKKKYNRKEEEEKKLAYAKSTNEDYFFIHLVIQIKC